jgi:hypothetical protein
VSVRTSSAGESPEGGSSLKISAGNIYMWAGIFSIPPLAVWYADHFPSVHVHMPSWGANAALTIGFVLVVVMLLANAVVHANIDHKWRATTRPTPVQDTPPASRPPSTLPPVIQTVATESSSPERIVANVTPQDLVRVCIDHLDHQAQTLIQPFIGKWLKVTGPIFDIGPIFNVSTDQGGWFVSVLLTKTTENEADGHDTQIILYSQPQWKDRLSILSRNQNVNVLGQIKKVSWIGIQLEDCELIVP